MSDETVIEEDQVTEDQQDNEIEADTTEEISETNESLPESEDEEVNTKETLGKTEESEDETEEDSEVVITFGDEELPSSEEEEENKKAPSWVKDLRKTNREQAKRLKELEREKAATAGATMKPVELGIKPKLEDYDFDADKYESNLSDWYERKQEVKELESKQKIEVKAQEAEWQKSLDRYSESKTKLKVSDYEEAEYIAQELLSQTQQGMIVQGSDNPALVTYALGKNPKKLKELSLISDPVKFAFTVAKLETTLNVKPKKRPESRPEKTLKSGTNSSGTVDSTMERLRSDAEKSGDYSKIMQYKTQLRRK